MGKKRNKETVKAHQQRQEMNEAYEQYNIEPTDGYRSRLEALWVAEFEDCAHFRCVECVQVPLWIVGPYGKFLSNYTPDLQFELADESKVFVELKPNTKLALEDDRQKRALELNPHYRFTVIGGYPYQKRGVTCRLLTGTSEKVYEYVSVCQIRNFLGCEC